MSFDGLLAECQPGADAASLFSRAWSVWGANARMFTSDPVASVASIKTAKAVFDFLAAQPLDEKPLSKIELCRTQIGSLLIVAAPEPKPAAKPAAAAAKAEAKGSGAYAGGIAAPKPEALPSPSILFGQKSPPAPPPPAAVAADPVAFTLDRVRPALPPRHAPPAGLGTASAACAARCARPHMPAPRPSPRRRIPPSFRAASHPTPPSCRAASRRTLHSFRLAPRPIPP